MRIYQRAQKRLVIVKRLCAPKENKALGAHSRNIYERFISNERNARQERA